VQVKIKGYGFDWQSVTPTSFNIGVSTNASGVVLEDLSIIKIFLDSSSFNTVMRRCKDVSYINRFSEAGVFEDCVFSAAISGGGTDFGKRAKWIRCIFKENVDVNITQEGGIFKDCVFEKNLDTGVAQLTIYDNCTVHGTLTGDNNTAFAGKVTFRNVIVDGAATIDGKKYVFIGGMIRGALNLNSNSVDCLFWNTRIKGTITDGGTGNEVLNEAECALEASVQAVKAKTDKLTFNAADMILSDLREVNDIAVAGPNDLKADVSALLTTAAYVDYFNKEVLTRDGEEPATYKLGTGGAAKTIDVDHVVIGSKKKADKETVL
jgi:hypothetical protein